MKITMNQLRRLIKECMNLQEGVLYVTRGPYGTTVADSPDVHNDPKAKVTTIGDMVLALLQAGDDDIFQAPQGVDPEALANLNQKHAEGLQGGMQKWDSHVFEDYYSVDNERVIRLYAKLMNHSIENIPYED